MTAVADDGLLDLVDHLASQLRDERGDLLGAAAAHARAAAPLLPPDLLPVPNSASRIATDLEANVASVTPEAAPRVPASPTDLDDDEAVLPTARADRLVDLVGVSMEGIAHG